MNSWAKKANNESYAAPAVTQSARYSGGYRTESRTSDNYHDRYMQLSSNVAQRHPHQSQPRERMGRIGGSWRHIREVLGYTGTQVCFVDGLVSLYDKDTMSNGSQRGPAWRARLSGPTGYSANLSGHELTGSLGNSGPTYELNHNQTTTGGDSKYKGFYTLRQ